MILVDNYPVVYTLILAAVIIIVVYLTYIYINTFNINFIMKKKDSQ